jgi:hypothetical protein
MSDSRTAGPLLPITPLPLSDAALDAAMQGFIAALSGIAPNLVRPRWQPTLPVIPEVTVDWCSIGILQIRTYGAPVMQMIGDQILSLVRQCELTCLCSFYGPNGQGIATQVRDGAALAQNRFSLLELDMNICHVNEVVSLPSLVSTQWMRRYDLTITIGMKSTRLYNVFSLLRATGQIESTQDTTQFDTNFRMES